MNRTLPPLDVHAHIASDIAPRSLEGLGAVVFAATRSLAEFAEVAHRADAVTIWGVGCHPGLAKAQMEFEAHEFTAQLQRTSFVSEVGLDGASRVPMERQSEVFASVLEAVTSTPRLVSVHSFRATAGVLDHLETARLPGAILHWWLGTEADTKRALELRCLFSVNHRMDVGALRAAGVPLESLLPETDHPSGNRGTDRHQPGWTLDVERAIAKEYQTKPEMVREQFWRTLCTQVKAQGVVNLLPPAVQAMLAHADLS